MIEKRILILTSDTGGGHTSAAKALEAGFERFTDGVSYLTHIVKALEEFSSISRRLAALYNYLLRHKQQYVKYYHWLINKLSPDETSLFNRLFISYGKQLLDTYAPDAVVSVHPMMQCGFARFLSDAGLAAKVPFITVVTDPCGNSWKGWANKGVDLYTVARAEAAEELIRYGIPGNRIKLCGMPVHPKFQPVTETEAERLRVELGLAPDRFTVFVNSGWAGGGNIPQIFSELIKSDLDIQAVFLAGTNDKLLQRATRLAAQAPFPVKVIGFSDQMEKLMAAANVMISKLGGLTTFEALTCRLPIIADLITPPMPQERGAADLIAQNRAGILLRQASDIALCIRELSQNREEYLSMRAAAGSLSAPDATRRIVYEITELLNRSKTQGPPYHLRR